MRVFQSEAAVVQVPDVPRVIEPEEEAALAVSMSEATRFEGNNLIEFERHIAVAEPKHETVAEVTEVPRLKGRRSPKRHRCENCGTVPQVHGIGPAAAAPQLASLGCGDNPSCAGPLSLSHLAPIAASAMRRPISPAPYS